MPQKKLILYLSELNNSNNICIASTLAWLAKSKNHIFDNYYDSYHKGVHFGGGDFRGLDPGILSGGTICGDRHFEQFYYVLLNFDVSIVLFRKSVFSQSINKFHVPTISSSKLSSLYKRVFNHFDAELPTEITMIGANYDENLSGLEAYLYPEIFYRRTIGVTDRISEEELSELYQNGSKIYCVHVDNEKTALLQEIGYDIEIIDVLKNSDDFKSVTVRIASRWKDRVKGWLIGDPILVSHWIPKACEEDLMALYSVPQDEIISEHKEAIRSKGHVIYGRQYDDKDFFELSKLNKCLQILDPCRPPFQSVKHAQYCWNASEKKKSFYELEYSDEELKQFAQEGKILISLMFWSGMIREIANFYNLMDLFAITRLKCGLVLTAQSFEYMMHSPLELVVIPLEQGGVHPLVEPVLGSCGIGVGIESVMAIDRLQDDLKDGLSRILKKVKKKDYVPHGWWPTMDAKLEKLNWIKRPKPFKFMNYSPYFQIRFDAKLIQTAENIQSVSKNQINSKKQRLIGGMRRFVKRVGLSKYFSPYRPFEFYGAGPMNKDIINTAKSVGLKYMFTKAAFKSNPEIKYIDENFIAMNYTAGQWDGWTPFETTNDVSDLKRAERVLLKKNKPGWIVSTIDSCLWTFSGEFWERGCKLYEIAKFCSNGGNSKSLINVKPFTIARYARIIAELNGQPK